MKTHLYKHAENLWQFLRLNHQPEPADLMVVFVSSDLRIAEFAASLFKQNLAPNILFIDETAAEEPRDNSRIGIFSDTAHDCGVPRSAMFSAGPLSSEGGESACSVIGTLTRQGTTDKILLVQKPFMERRINAGMMQQYSSSTIAMRSVSPPLDFFDYLNDDMTSDLVLWDLLADFEKWVEYQASATTPASVMQAYHALRQVL